MTAAPRKRWDWSRWWSRLSTVITAVAAGCQLAAVYFIATPPEWKGGFPAVYGFVLLGVGMAANLLIPAATSFKQKPKP